jgi:amino acid permease
MERAFGHRGRRFTTVLLFLLLTLVLFAFLILLRDILADTMEYFIGHAESYQTKFSSLIIVAFAGMPLLVSQNLYSLRYASYCGFFSVMILLLTITQRAIHANADQTEYFAGQVRLLPVCFVFASCLLSVCLLFAFCLLSVCFLFAFCLLPVCILVAFCSLSVCFLRTGF